MWYPVYGFEGSYEVNEIGQVRSLLKNIIMQQGYDNRGYLKVSLRRDGQSFSKGVHRLMMESICPVDNMAQLTVNHKNHIKDDNRIENLEWMSNSDNVKEAYAAGLHDGKHAGGNNKKAVRCVETGVEYPSAAEAARLHNISSRGKIGAACRNPKKTCAGFHWEFVE